MVGLVSILAGEILYESIKFVIMLGLLVAQYLLAVHLERKKMLKKPGGKKSAIQRRKRVKKVIFGFL